MSQHPQLSIIVVAHDMPRQAMNTLYSLSPAYQRDVNPADYEVLVVENASGNELDAGEVARLGDNFDYRLRQEPGVSPVPAINEALARCRGEYLGLLIDGARMLTPRVLHYALQALQLPGALVAVPGYYLTEAGKTETGASAGDAARILEQERDLLQRLNWHRNGYALFQQACFSNGNRNGFLEPLMECNALFCPRAALTEQGGLDTGFDLPGGGAINLHLYRQLATAAGSAIYLLPGEGNFHQFHSGTSTSPGAERDALVQTFKAQLDERWPGGFQAVRREPRLFGAVSPEAMPFLERSAQSSALRAQRLAGAGRALWEDEQAVRGTA